MIRSPVAESMLKEGEGMSEIEKAVQTEIFADCSIRISH